jgi:acetyl-CoA acetyltransferase
MTRQHTRKRAGYDGVVVCVPITVPYQRHSIQSAHWWIGRALRALVTAAALRPGDIDGLSVSSFTLAPDTAVALTQHFGLSPRWLDHVPMGGASGVIALRRAARAVQAGDAEFVACVAGDTNQVDTFRRTLQGFSRFAQDAVYPYGAGGPNASFALITQYYMERYGATRADFGKICVAQRDNAMDFGPALLRQKLTLDSYLAARAIADPIHLFDCVMPCAGAEAFLVCRADSAEQLGLAGVRVLATIERHNAFPDDPVQFRGGWAMDVDELWQMAGVTAADVDVLETYDDYPVISMMQFEDLGFCDKGAAAEFVRGHDLTALGSFPHNTSGGQLSAGQAGAAGGYLGLVELLRQLTGSAIGTQVPGAHIGVASGFGMINYDRGLASAAVVLAAA